MHHVHSVLSVCVCILWFYWLPLRYQGVGKRSLRNAHHSYCMCLYNVSAVLGGVGLPIPVLDISGQNKKGAIAIVEKSELSTELISNSQET